MIIVVMGVTGCGKSTVGEMLANRLGLAFHDGDHYHPPANREKLKRDIPLGDEDRYPWLQSLASHMSEWERTGGAVVACSALKEKYRAILRTGASDTVFVYLKVDKTLTATRLAARAVAGHELVKDFDRILDGQFRDLEEPADAITVENDERAPAVVVEEIASQLAKRSKNVFTREEKP